MLYELFPSSVFPRLTDVGLNRVEFTTENFGNDLVNKSYRIINLKDCMAVSVGTG